MDGRKVSSLSILSDTSSDCVSPRAMNLIVENIGHIPVTDTGAGLTSLKAANSFLSLMSGETKVFLAELKLRADSECLAARHALLDLPGVKAEEKRYLDCCVLQTGSDVRLALLGERKNKERFVVLVEVMVAGRGLSLGRELAVYDKASMLGKGLTHITATEADVFTCGSLIRKLRMEEGGGVLKPTTGRVAVPPECVDGTLCLRVVSQPAKNSFTIVSSFKTKSAGKNKYQINWFQGRGDEISAASQGKSSLKLSDDQEPSCILSDPRDTRAVYLICNNHSDHTAALYKLIKGRKLEEPITTFPFPVTEATLMVGTDKNLFLLALDPSGPGLKVFHVMKTQGYRGTSATWSRCPELASLCPATQAVSCSSSKWQLSPQLTDSLLSPRCPYQLALATLLNNSNEIATEPESGLQYRLRALGGDGVNDAILIILDDIERIFEAEEDALSSMTLKICLTTQPCREGMKLLLEWLSAARIYSAEIYGINLDKEGFVGLSDRLQINTIGQEFFRSNIVEQDWTQNIKRGGGGGGGTFVLDDSDMSASITTPASIRLKSGSVSSSSGSRPVSRSKIPSAMSSHRKSTGMESSFTNGSMMNTSMTMSMSSSEDVLLAVRQVEDSISPLARANNQIRDSLSQLEKSLLILKAATIAETPTSD